MTTFNKILINSIENDTISKDDYYKILTLLSEIKDNKNKSKELEKEKLYLINELLFIKSKDSKQIYYFAQKELNDSLNYLYNTKEIELFKKLLNAQKGIFEILQKYSPPQQSKSSIKKYTKHLQYLNNKKAQIEDEIQKNKNELRIIKTHFHKKQTLERYNNNLIRFALPHTKKEILKQKLYIEIFTKNKGR